MGAAASTEKRADFVHTVKKKIKIQCEGGSDGPKAVQFSGGVCN